MPDENVASRLARVRRALGAPAGGGGGGGGGGLGGLESLDGGDDGGDEGGGDTPPLVDERQASATAAELHRIVDDYLDGESKLHDLVREVEAQGRQGLALLAGGREEDLLDRPDAIGGLEAIIQSDGTRPSFLVRDGDVDLKSSPAGTWRDALVAEAAALRDAIACVGRIDNPAVAQGFAGTGFLVQENLILTNRHVLQAIADKDGDAWRFRVGVAIDFGHEYRGAATQGRRALRRVLFAGASRIGGPVDHTKLDLALIELEPAAAGQGPRAVLSVDASADWHGSGPQVYVLGYAGAPSEGQYTPTVLERLFQQTFGYKRLAPGVAKRAALAGGAAWTAAHDATTLGGNSGSLVLVAGRSVSAAALHYGGQPGVTGENWAHVLGATLDATPAAGGGALRDVLKAQGVVMSDRAVR